MRPRRLEIEGFASFRERTEVDFSDADLFVLCGPTGAGKSSLIDAITFALYGAVPRYDNQTLVWPVISQGLAQAKVRLDFTVGDEAYTAVRVVSRTSAGGASTKQARLVDAAGRVLASTADELTAEVVRRIGLPFEQFTRCVVLPQGDFAEFLHASPGERQQLLVQLLGLDVFRRIGQAAHQRGVAAASHAALIEGQLEGLADATEDALAAARLRVAALEELVALIEALRPEVDAAAAEHERAGQAALDADARARLLDGVTLPPGLDEVARAAANADAALVEADAALEAAARARENAAAAADAVRPEVAPAQAALDRHGRRDALGPRLRDAEAAAAGAAAAAARAAAALETADGAARDAAERVERLQRDHSAAHLAEHLVAGERCPVCLQTVRKLPQRQAPPDIDRARSARTRAEKALRAARDAAQAAAKEDAARTADAEALTAQRTALDRELHTLPAAPAARAVLERLAGAERALREAVAAEADAKRRQGEARAGMDAARQRLDREWRRFDLARDALAAKGLGPPPASRRDLRVDWTALVDWARDRAPAERQAADAQRDLAAAARARLDGVGGHIARACIAAAVDPGARAPRDAAADALAAARAHAERLARDHAAAAALRADLDRLRKDAALARELARLLDARNFERWLMNRALRLLLAGASRVLRDLSAGAYSLGLDSRNEFLVIDHRNADERRMARTLSGGETFLASLALALALADHLADLASGGAARLDALFLDEGFGTLDADTLDTVAAAIEELGSRGRMVGLVTHVRDLAERIPVRFEVRKTGNASSVEKVIA